MMHKDGLGLDDRSRMTLCGIGMGLGPESVTSAKCHMYRQVLVFGQKTGTCLYIWPFTCFGLIYMCVSVQPRDPMIHKGGPAQTSVWQHFPMSTSKRVKA